MKTKIYAGLIAFVVICILAALLLPVHLQQAQLAFVEASLMTSAAETVDLIVSAKDTDTAAQAVTATGGQVLEQLWLINAVSARLPGNQLSRLSAYPGVVSITQNREIKPADSFTASGRVSDRREILGQFNLNAITKLAPTLLPDGGAFFITEDGKALITNANGTERARFNLVNCGFRNAPVVAQDGSIFLACENKIIFAINADGSLRWKFSHSSKFFAGVALGVDGRLYAIDEKRDLLALSLLNGKIAWLFQLAGDKAGVPQNTPVIGPDGTVYITTNADPSWVFAVSPDGALKWSFFGDRGKHFIFKPITNVPGRVFAVSMENVAYAINAVDGKRLYACTTASRILTQPIAGADGSLYVATEDGSLNAFKPDGRLLFRFKPVSGHFKTSPLLSADQSIVYAAIQEKVLYAVDVSTGVEKWRYTASANINASPVLDAFGNVVFGSDGNDLVILNTAGKVITRLILEDKITFPAASGSNGEIAVIVGDHNATMLGLLPDRWDGGPDVEPTDIKRVWSLSNPIPVDIGSDQLYDQGISGQGITVAVLDSGVYFNKHVEDILGTDLDKQFLGQADFVGNGVCSRPGGMQRNGYCFSSHESSVDPYGHGSHVTGIIWSQIIDWATQVHMGIAPDANTLSVRVLDNKGTGTYADVIEGIQYVVANKKTFNIRVINLSISAIPTSPYFVDPLDRAVEQAWANGIVVVAAAGNLGPSAESISVPGNDPYVITVGALNDRRTPGYWTDDVLPGWSSNGPTSDGFIKPDVVAPGSNIISFMYTDKRDSLCASLARDHPDFSRSISLFRMSGTSMSTAVVSGVVALMLQANPKLTPDQVKFRLKYSAVPVTTDPNGPVFPPLQQGNGRVWAPAAVLNDTPADAPQTQGMDIQADRAHGSTAAEDLAFHHRGPVVRVFSDDGQTIIYNIPDQNGSPLWMGASRVADLQWLDRSSLDAMQPTWGGGNYTWGGGNYTWGGGNYTWGGGNYTWGGGNYTWGGGNYTWGGTAGDKGALLNSVSTPLWVEDN